MQDILNFAVAYKKENNTNKMQVTEIKKTIAYAFWWTEVLPNKVWKASLSSKMVFGVCYIRVFCKFPGFMNTTVVRDEMCTCT